MKQIKNKNQVTHFELKEYLFVYKFLTRFCQNPKIESNPHSSGGFSFIRLINTKIDHIVISKLKNEFEQNFKSKLLFDNSYSHQMIISKII